MIGLFRKDPPAPSYPVLPEVNERVGLNDGFDLADELGSSPRGAAEYDVVIVGAGVAGMATALRLQERGLLACAVDVMAFAKNGLPFSNRETSCIHCGICITACPMDVLKFEQLPSGGSKVTVDAGVLSEPWEPARVTAVGSRPSEASLGEPGRGWRIQGRSVDEARRRSSGAAAGRFQAITRTVS
ncbi:MAG: FAD-binding protein [Planctomycetota bacterium]